MRTVLVPGVAWPTYVYPPIGARSEASLTTRVQEWLKNHPGSIFEDVAKAFPQEPKNRVENALRRLARNDRVITVLISHKNRKRRKYSVGVRA